jgi:outer membrane protein assembly factor BamD (BamD/ComL family)
VVKIVIVKEKEMRKLLLVFCLALSLAGCGDRAKELYETAQFEEKQTNIEHAGKLYRQILEKYPNSPYATQAKARLAELER